MGRRFAVLICTALILSSAVFGRHLDEYLPPQLNSLEERAIFLGFLSREIPGLFSEATEYDVDVLKFLEDQRTSIDHLQKQAGFVEGLRDRGGLLEIHVYREVKVKLPSGSFVDPQAVDQIDASRAREIIKDPKGALAKFSERLSQRYADNQDTFGSVRLKSAVGGILALLPKEIAGPLYRLKLGEQIDRLEKLEPEVSLALAKFRFADAGLQPMPAHDFLETLAEAHHKQRKTYEYALLTALASLETAEPSGNTLRANPDEWLRTLLEELILQKKLGEHLKAVVGIPGEFADQLVKDATAKLEGKTLPERHAILTLKEAPGYLATLRGFVGVDCSTQYSFPYALLPAERTFFVLGPDGDALGYLMVTTNKWNGETALYLHDFSGPRISPKMTVTALAALQAALGNHALILPEPAISLRNINFKHIRAAIDGVAASGTRGHLTYPDAPLRATMASIPGLKIDHRFDTPQVNATGLKVGSIGLNSAKIEIRRAEWPPANNGKLSRSETAFLALEIDFPEWSKFSKHALTTAMGLTESPNAIASQRRVAATKIASMATSRATELLQTVSQVFPNSRNLSVDAYLEAVAAAVEPHDLKLEDIVNGHPHLLFEGILNCPNPFTGPPEGAVLAVQALKALLIHRGQAEFAYPAIEKWKRYLENNEPFQDVLRQMVRDRALDLGTLRAVLGLGMSPAALEPALARLQEIASNSKGAHTRNHAKEILDLYTKRFGSQALTCIRALLEQASKEVP